MQVTEQLVATLSAEVRSRSLTHPLDALRWLVTRFPETATFSTSFGLEDQVITHLIFSNDLPIRVFTLDTGRNFQETYSTWERTLEKYGKPIVPYFPQTDAVQNLLSEKGPNSFYDSVDDRKQCCFIRKVEPLGRALKGAELWVTGIRADQSPNRYGMEAFEWDASHSLVKFHPLFHWTFEEARAFARENKIPCNPLHDKGFLSIGCAPCTRAIRDGEDFRAGRWWWEDTSKKECGLHVHAR